MKKKYNLPNRSMQEIVWKYFTHCKNGAFSSKALLMVEAENMCGSFITCIIKQIRIKFTLTLSHITNFRLSQTERVCR